MHKIIKIILFILLLVSSPIFSQQPQLVFGADATYNLPLGMMSDRMKSNIGGLFYVGAKISPDWTWVGKAEYFKLTEVNEDQMFKFVTADFSGSRENYRFSLPGITMEFTAAGIIAEARYNLFASASFEGDLNFGFGFHYWEYSRDSYNDSLFVDSSGTGNLIFVEALDVPSLKQKDWSGSIILGADFNLKLFEPVWFNAGVNYKLIIGELWPSLALNLENVSGLQFIDFRAGIRFKL